MAAAAYPESFPVSNAINLFGIIRAGQLSAKKAEAGWDVWQIQGYGHRVLFGVPAGQSALGVSVLSADDLSHVKNLIQAIEDCKADVAATTEQLDAQAARDRPFLRMLIEQMLPILLKLFLPTT